MPPGERSCPDRPPRGSSFAGNSRRSVPVRGNEGEAACVQALHTKLAAGAAFRLEGASESEGIRSNPGLDLPPCHRRGDGKSWPYPGRPRARRRGAATVAQIVDEEPARSLRHRGRDRVAAPVGRGEALGERPAVTMRLVLADRLPERRHDVQALAAGDIGPGREALLLQQAAEFKGGVDHERPFDAGAWIEIEHEAIGMLGVVNYGVPGMQFNGT